MSSADTSEIEQHPMNSQKSDQQVRDRCCLRCKFFESRTSFCRFNPPTPIVTTAEDGTQHVTSIYSKVNYPLLDWCQKFEVA